MVMRVTFRRPNFVAEGKRLERDLRRRILQQLIVGLNDFQDAIMQTPVYTGKTLVNYRWSLGTPVEGLRPAVKEPDLPGTTSEMAIGTEPRRKANSVPVTEEFRAMIAELRRTQNPYVKIYLTNSVPYFTEVEYGTYSTSEGHSVRTPPGGMTRRGEAMLMTHVRGLRKR